MLCKTVKVIVKDRSVNKCFCMCVPYQRKRSCAIGGK